MNANWRKMTPQAIPDLNMKDIEILLRGFAMLVNHNDYKPSLKNYLNSFSNKAKKFTKDDIKYFEDLFIEFIDKSSLIDNKLFFGKSGRFNISVYESVFVAICENAYKNRNLVIKETSKDKIERLKSDSDFIIATQSKTANSTSVTLRIEKAKDIL